MDKLIKDILADLYQIDPTLKKMEPKLIKIINELIAAKPNTKFDEQFKKDLYHQLMVKAEELKTKNMQKFNLLKFTKKTYYIVGSLVILILFILPSLYLLDKSGVMPSKTNNKLALNVQQTRDNAFGEIALEGTDGQTASSEAKGLGGGGGGYTTDMIAPRPDYINYSYKYIGSDLEILDDKMAVLKRETEGFNQTGFNSLVQNLGAGLISLDRFNDTEITNLNFAQDKDYGYSFYIDFRNGNISISENWETWPQCQDQKCFDDRRLTIDDMPSDDQIIDLTNSFINQYGINTNSYGQPEVNKSWLIAYEQYENKEDFYLPETITVTYPLLINNKIAYDEGGNPYGLNINVNIRENRVSGLYNLTSQNYQSSLYNIESDGYYLIKMAEKGGLYSSYYNYSDKTEELKLDTPSLNYLKIYQYNGNQTSELLIPALIFPIIDPPTENGFYKKNVIVPLVEKLTNNNPGTPVRIMEDSISQ